MSDDLIARRELIKDVISDYTTNDVLSLIEGRIKNGNLIEAYAITDQYIAEMVSRLLVVNEGELTKIRETINVVKTLDIMMRLGVVDGVYKDYQELVKSFKKTRNKLIHIYFNTAINLLRSDISKLKKNRTVNIEEEVGINKEKTKFFLEFLLNLYSISLKKKKSINKKKIIGDFSTFLTRVISEIVPIDEKRSGVKSDYKEFAAYLLKLIRRDLDYQSFEKGKVGI